MIGSLNYSELLGDKKTTRRKKRQCAHPGCLTILNMYNKKKYCLRHTYSDAERKQ